jgi:hypothetical protein
MSKKGMGPARQPWDEVFDRVRVWKSADYIYPFRPTAAELDAVEVELGYRLPASYRIFVQRFGVPGELDGWVRLNKVAGEIEELDHVVGATREWRRQFAEHPGAAEEIGVDFATALIAFGTTGGGNTFAWHPGEVTNRRLAEYKVYEVHRLGSWSELLSDTFADFVAHMNETVRGWEDEDEDDEDEDSGEEPSDTISYHPWGGSKRPISSKMVKTWLAGNAKAADNLARTIRDEGRIELFPLLGDALEDAGCDSEHLLRACRDGNPQADGEWVLAVLLGKMGRRR